MSKGFTSSPRIALLAGVILLSFVGISVRLVSLHVLDREELMKFVVKARRQVIPDKARRGDILDSRGGILATSRPQVKLGVDPQVLRPEDEKKWPQLAELLGMPLPQLRTIMTTMTRRNVPRKSAGGTPAAAVPLPRIVLPGAKAPEPVMAETRVPAAKPSPAPAFNFILAPNAAATPVVDEADDTVVDDLADATGYHPIRWATLSHHVDEAIYDKIVALDIKGVIPDPSYVYQRSYPHNGLAAHLIGYVNREGIPVTGMEAYADFYLRGRDGWREGEMDGRGRELAQFRTRDVPRADGYNVKLSIDSNVQSIIEDEMAALVGKYQPLKATIIVSDPRTGFIWGLANYPSYQLNDYGQAGIAAQRNIAVTDVYDPGSVFKIVAAAGALDAGLVTSQTTFDCSLERIEYYGAAGSGVSSRLVRKLPREDHTFDHRLSVAEIIARSSNRGADQLAMKLGDQKYYQYVKAFGFGQLTGFPVGGEVASRVAPPEQWDSMTITRMPMGHSVSVTVMQMHQAMGIIASGGVLLRPQLIRQITDPAGETVLHHDPVEVRRVISPATAKTMAQLLMGVASTKGTAPEAAIPNFQVAGKTGTTQKLIDGQYSETHHVASFVGFFPASRPEVVISVIVDDADAHAPGGVAYGSKIAAPAFKHIGEQLIQLPYLNIKPVYEPSRDLVVMEGGRR